MRKMLRRIAKAKLRKMGYQSNINASIGHGRWREITNAYPIDIISKKRMPKDYIGRKRYEKGQYSNHLFRYSVPKN